jgi:nucleoside-diphosphate-sugar epimerase
MHAALPGFLSALSRQTQREVVILRPFGPYGPGDDKSRIIPHVTLALLNGDEVRVSAGAQLRDYLYVSDHIAALLLAATRPLTQRQAIFNVGSGESISIRALVETVARAVSPDAIKRVKFGAVPYRDDEIWQMCGDITAARQCLGFVPSVSLTEGISKTVEWYRNHDSTGNDRIINS